MLRITVIRKDDNTMSPLLKSNSSIDDKTLSASDAKIRMEKDDGGLLLVCHLGTSVCVDGGGGHAIQELQLGDEKELWGRKVVIGWRVKRYVFFLSWEVGRGIPS
jgi:hypothetical protein